MDALGSAIRIDTRGREVMRILPRLNEAVNEEWISDKARQIIDGLKTPAPRPPLRAREWQAEAGKLAGRLRRHRGQGQGDGPGKYRCHRRRPVVGRRPLCRQGLGRKARREESSTAVRMARSSIRRWAAPPICSMRRSRESTHADALLIIGSNPRWEAPVLNARIRRRWRAGHFPVALIGERADLTYDYDHLGAGPGRAGQARAGPADLARSLAKAERPLILVGQGALARDDGAAILRWLPARADSAPSKAAGPASTCCIPRRRGSARSTSASCRGRAVSTPSDMAEGRRARRSSSCSAPTRSTVEPGAFVVYQRHPWRPRRPSRRRDPAGRGLYRKVGDSTSTPKAGCSCADRAAFPPGEAREDWAILRALSGLSASPCPSIRSPRCGRSCYAAHPHLRADRRDRTRRHARPGLAADGRRGRWAAAPFSPPIADFYLTNPIARASRVMAECSALAHGPRTRNRRRNRSMTLIDLLLSFCLIVVQEPRSAGRRV